MSTRQSRSSARPNRTIAQGIPCKRARGISGYRAARRGTLSGRVLIAFEYENVHDSEAFTEPATGTGRQSEEGY